VEASFTNERDNLTQHQRPNTYKFTTMGFSITWFAVPENNVEAFLTQLQLTPTGDTEELPDSLISLGKLDTGWSVLWYNEYQCPFLGELKVAAISENFDVLWCQVEEHAMASSAELWSKGKRKWRISHEGENGPKGLDTDGELPEALSAIRQEMEATQKAEGGENAEVDFIFEIPLKVAEKIIGFKHDQECPHLTGNQFHVLTRPTPKPGLFGRLFGKK
jgi:hypothetical protein